MFMHRRRCRPSQSYRLAAARWWQALPSVISQQENNSSNDTEWPTLTKRTPGHCHLSLKQHRNLPACPMESLSSLQEPSHTPHCLWRSYTGLYLQTKGCRLPRQKRAFINSYVHLWGTPNSHVYWVSSTTNL